MHAREFFRQNFTLRTRKFVLQRTHALAYRLDGSRARVKPGQRDTLKRACVAIKREFRDAQRARSHTTASATALSYIYILLRVCGTRLPNAFAPSSVYEYIACGRITEAGFLKPRAMYVSRIKRAHSSHARAKEGDSRSHRRCSSRELDAS